MLSYVEVWCTDILIHLHACVQLSWMATWGHAVPKPSTCMATVCLPQTTMLVKMHPHIISLHQPPNPAARPWLKELYQRLPQKTQKRLKRKASIEMVIKYRDSQGNLKVSWDLVVWLCFLNSGVQHASRITIVFQPFWAHLIQILKHLAQLGKEGRDWRKVPFTQQHMDEKSPLPTASTLILFCNDSIYHLPFMVLANGYFSMFNDL